MAEPTDDKYLHGHQAAATTPLAQSLISGVVVFVLVFVICVWVNAEDTLMKSLTAGVCMVAAVWFGRLWQWMRLTERIEEYTGIDLPGGLPADEIPPVRRTLKVEIQHRAPAGNVTSGQNIYDLDEGVMLRIAAALHEGASFSAGDMVEKRKAITRGEYDTIAPQLIAAGLMEWKNADMPRLGMRPTATGLATFEALLSPRG
jgi:hypothetical protein